MPQKAQHADWTEPSGLLQCQTVNTDGQTAAIQRIRTTPLRHIWSPCETYSRTKIAMK